MSMDHGENLKQAKKQQLTRLKHAQEIQFSAVIIMHIKNILGVKEVQGQSEAAV